MLNFAFGFVLCAVLWWVSWYLDNTPELDDEDELAPGQGELFEDTEAPRRRD